MLGVEETVRYTYRLRPGAQAVDALIAEWHRCRYLWNHAVKRTLIEYAVRAGRKVVLVQPAYTTMTCSGCGTRTKDRLLLDERTFSCQACGLVEDRDRNAARTILAVAERAHTSVESVRHLEPPFGVLGAA